MGRLARSALRSPNAVWVNFEPHRRGTAPHVHTTKLAQAFTDLTGRATRVIGSPRPNGGVNRLVRWLSVLVTAVVVSRRSRLIYARSGPPALLLAIWARARRVPLVLEVNGLIDDAAMVQRLPGPIERLATATIARQIGMADVVVCPTREVAVECRRLGATTTSIIPAGVDPGQARMAIERVERCPTSWSTRPYLSFVGFLAPWSGVELVLAASRSTDWPAGVDLVICGDGPLRPEVERADGPVRYLGQLEHEEAIEVLAGSIATFSLKRYRSGRMSHYPMKVIEACSLGVPSLVTDAPAQNRLVRGTGCGLVLPDDLVDRPDELARLIRDHLPRLQDPAMRARCREAVADQTWADRAEALQSILHRPPRPHRSPFRGHRPRDRGSARHLVAGPPALHHIAEVGSTGPRSGGSPTTARNRSMTSPGRRPTSARVRPRGGPARAATRTACARSGRAGRRRTRTAERLG